MWSFDETISLKYLRWKVNLIFQLFEEQENQRPQNEVKVVKSSMSAQSKAMTRNFYY